MVRVNPEGLTTLRFFATGYARYSNFTNSHSEFTSKE